MLGSKNKWEGNEKMKEKSKRIMGVLLAGTMLVTMP